MLQPPPAAGEPAGAGVCPPGGSRQTLRPQGEEDHSSQALAVFSFFNFFIIFNFLCRFSEEELKSTPYSLGAGTPCQNGLKNQQILSQGVLMKMKYETYFCVIKKENFH